MGKNRLEAFSDGVLAIIITIMVLELKIPEGQGIDALLLILPTFLSYILSFVYVGIYWNNHHHLLHTLQKVTGPVLWANHHLLFWLSLVPFASGWMGANPSAKVPAALYGIVLLMASIAYNVLQKMIINAEQGSSTLKQAIGNDTKGKVSMLAYLTASGLAIIQPWIAQALYVILALLWLIPDRRIEPDARGRAVAGGPRAQEHRVRFLRGVLCAAARVHLGGLRDAPGDPRRGGGHHGGAHEPGRAAPAPGGVRRALLQDRGHRGGAGALLRHRMSGADDI